MHPILEKVDEIRDRGFAVIPGGLPAEKVSILRDLLQRAVEQDLDDWKSKHYSDAWMVHNLMVRHLEFARILENPTMHAYLTEFLTDTCIVYAYTSSSLPANGTNYSHRIHVDCPRFISGYVTNMGVIFALDEFTTENGATFFLPGSHLSDRIPTPEEFMARAEQAFPKSGDLVVFNARTWHMGGLNKSDRDRHALTINVCRSYMRQRFDYPRMMPDDILCKLGETGRRFLGYNVRMPTSLEQYYLPEEQRLYKANQG